MQMTQGTDRQLWQACSVFWPCLYQNLLALYVYAYTHDAAISQDSHMAVPSENCKGLPPDKCTGLRQCTSARERPLPMHCRAQAIHVAVIPHVPAACGRLHSTGLMMQQQVSRLTFVAEQVDLSSMSAWQQSYGAA